LLPTYAARGFLFSTFLDLARLPAMADFVRACMSAFFGGDASQWERALLMPHYSAAGMPACSLHQVGSLCVGLAGQGVWAPRHPCRVFRQYWLLLWQVIPCNMFLYC
jgi:hypothetical protein